MSTPRFLDDTAHEHPGLEAYCARAMDLVKDELRPEMGAALLFAFHYGDDPNLGLAWVASCPREQAISMVVEWLRRQADEGYKDAILAAFSRFFKETRPPERAL